MLLSPKARLFLIDTGFQVVGAFAAAVVLSFGSWPLEPFAGGAMIRNQWYVILESRELCARPLGLQRMGERLVLWRDERGRPVCAVDRCAHRGASLALGRVVGPGSAEAWRDGSGPAVAPGVDREGCRVQCPFHGIEYDSSGRATFVPANGRAAAVPEGYRLASYPTHEERGFIWIFWAEDGSAPPAPPGYFDDIPERMRSSTISMLWDNHYSRVIENQLDVAHLPFVHFNTIGRGGATLVEGPGVLAREEGFFVFTFNKVDDGSKPRSPEEVPVPPRDRVFKLEFRFPNLWQNYIGEKMRIVAAFVPVDEGRTLMYLRLYQSFVRAPLIEKIVFAIGNRYNYRIADQDRRVVNSQLPKGSGEATGELLFPGDRAIMEYRKLRHEARKGLAAE